MHAKEQTLKQLLEGEKQYVVPLYQRTYAWQARFSQTRSVPRATLVS